MFFEELSCKLSYHCCILRIQTLIYIATIFAYQSVLWYLVFRQLLKEMQAKKPFCFHLPVKSTELKMQLLETDKDYARSFLSSGYETIGCYKDTGNRAIPIIEGSDPVLDGSYGSRKNAIAKCAVAAMRKGYSMFAVQNGGHCQASATAPQTFDKHGKSTACRSDGEGGSWANQVYVIKGNNHHFLPIPL